MKCSIRGLGCRRHLPKASWLMKQRPETATHCAPWTKASTSAPVVSTIRATSGSVHSRARTILFAPCERRNSTAAEFETDICVETCISTPRRRHISKTPQSETMKASTCGIAASMVCSTSSFSPSNIMALNARYALAPRSRHLRAISGKSASEKFTPLLARMLKVPRPK